MQLKTEYICCPNCGNDNARVWAEESGYSAMKCNVCALIYVNPRPTAAAISEANRLGVHNTAAGQLVVTTEFRPWKVWNYSRLVKHMFGDELAMARQLRWLDVGAGHGELVQAVQSLLPAGSFVLGIEPMEPKVNSAQSRGLNVENRSLSEVEPGFQVVSLINVFSHIPDFRAFLRSIREKLALDGVLLIETGNAADLAGRHEYPGKLDLPDHLVFTGIEQMRSLLASAGFELETHFARRMNGFIWAAKQTASSILKGKPAFVWPTSYAFRTVFFKARRV